MIENIDIEITLFINSLHNFFFDSVMQFFSMKYVWIPLYLLIGVIIIKKYNRQAILIILLISFLILLSDQLSVHLFKNVFERLRPCHNPYLIDKIRILDGHCGGKYGFISNHSTNSFAIALFTALIIGKRSYTILIIIWASIVAYSRIYLGVHYFFDVLVGALFGSLLAVLVFWIFQKIRNKINFIKNN